MLAMIHEIDFMIYWQVVTFSLENTALTDLVIVVLITSELSGSCVYFAEVGMWPWPWAGWSSGTSHLAKERPAHSPGIWFSPCGGFRNWHWDCWSFKSCCPSMYMFPLFITDLVSSWPCQADVEWPQTSHFLSEVFIIRIGLRVVVLVCASQRRRDFAAVSCI